MDVVGPLKKVPCAHTLSNIFSYYPNSYSSLASTRQTLAVGLIWKRSHLVQMASSILITDPPLSIGYLLSWLVIGTGWEIGPALLHVCFYSERQSSGWLRCICAVIHNHDRSKARKSGESAAELEV